MDTAIRMPAPLAKSGNMFEVKPLVSDGSNSFLAGSLVYLTSGEAAAIATDGVLCWGWSPGPSLSAGQHRPEVFWTEGIYAYDPTKALFLLNITDDSGHVGQANGAPTAVEAVVGSSYGIYRWTSGDYSGMQALNVDETSTTLFTVVAKPTTTASTDYNGLVIAQIIPSKIQG